MIYEKAPSAKYYTFEDLLETDGYLIYTNVGVSDPAMPFSQMFD